MEKLKVRPTMVTAGQLTQKTILGIAPATVKEKGRPNPEDQNNR